MSVGFERLLTVGMAAVLVGIRDLCKLLSGGEMYVYLNEDERAEIYHQINQILCDDCPWIGMFNSNLYALARTGISGVNINVETTYWYNTIHYED